MVKRFFNREELVFLPKSHHKLFKDIEGVVFGRLTVIGLASYGKNNYWYCECECGNIVSVSLPNLKSGVSASCGCLHREAASAAKTIHGHAPTSGASGTYSTWCGMKDRCNNSNSKFYVNYGGRGITVCERWNNKFENFLADMGERPPGLSIDRINNDGNYEPGNCRWATKFEQANNTRRNRRITYMSDTNTVAEWSNHLGFKAYVLNNRLRRGWSVDRAINEPINYNKSKNHSKPNA